MVSLGGVTRAMCVEPDDPSMLDRPQLGGRLDGRRLRCLPDGGRCAETMRDFGSVLQDPMMERFLQPPILLNMRQQFDKHRPMLDVLDGCKCHGRNSKTMEKDPVQVERAAGAVWQWLSDDGGSVLGFLQLLLNGSIPYSIPYSATFADNVHRCATGIKAMTMTKVEYQSIMVVWLCFADGDLATPTAGALTAEDLHFAYYRLELPLHPHGYRLERQSRGAVHAHSMVWADPSDSVQ